MHIVSARLQEAAGQRFHAAANAPGVFATSNLQSLRIASPVDARDQSWHKVLDLRFVTCRLKAIHCACAKSGPQRARS
ncbi:hypothetical protein HPB50_027463 [Hyalomma asiaticum]|uniref:Uncharacterized protein n=1 Tax=Hyalomma asiaticum TaxID=266040 RepID=A0ACB7S396_HYAAI|nr:hypothetical protein HPB50_027463 [Hyalomma asiaticum]